MSTLTLSQWHVPTAIIGPHVIRPVSLGIEMANRWGAVCREDYENKSLFSKQKYMTLNYFRNSFSGKLEFNTKNNLVLTFFIRLSQLYFEWTFFVRIILVTASKPDQKMLKAANPAMRS
jgi:hypothetical protein